MPKVTFGSRNSEFYTDLKEQADRYFTNSGKTTTGDWRLHIKTITLGAAAIIFYTCLLKFDFNLLTGSLLSGVLGFILACIGFNVMHDACHGSYSRRKWVNNTLGLTLNALGGNAFIWKFKHNIIHHTYTNVDGVDDDIAKSPLMRQCDTQKWVPAHRFQHMYVVLVYAISSFAWVFIMDFSKYFSRRVFRTPLQKMNRKEHMIFWASKVLYLLFYIAIPVYLKGWAAWGVGFAAMHVVMGLTLALVFQLAHVVETTDFELAGAEPKMIENEWAIHQVRTTANFAPQNIVVSWFVGGLNYQIEHHLFPRVSHVHYPVLSRMVRTTCARHNLPYNVFSTTREAVASHFKMIRNLGRKPTQMALS